MVTVDKLRVAVLMGGRSSEREVSLRSGAMIVRHLDRERYDVLPFDTGALHGLAGARAGEQARELQVARRDSRPQQRSRPEGSRPGESLPWRDAIGADLRALAPIAPRAIEPQSRAPSAQVAVIALHGRGGEDGAIQGLLELLDLPYTGSGILASALAMDKPASKRIFAAHGIPTAPWREYCMDNCADPDAIAADIASALSLPVVVKPAREGSTIGVSVVRRAEELADALRGAARYDSRVLAEHFIPGPEITAGVIGGREPQVLPLVEVVPRTGFYDYHAKYTPGATDEIVPARVDDQTARRASQAALAAFSALGCAGVARVDMIAGPEGPVVLEVNTIPGMTETSLVPRAAQAAGLSFPRLLDRMIELALGRE